jgi:hypothetical protein
MIHEIVAPGNLTKHLANPGTGLVDGHSVAFLNTEIAELSLWHSLESYRLAFVIAPIATMTIRQFATPENLSGTQLFPTC